MKNDSEQIYVISSDTSERFLEKEASFLSRITYSYLNPLFKIGSSKILQAADLYPLDKQNTAEYMADKLENTWKLTRNGKGSAGTKVCMASMLAFGRDFVISGIYLFMYNCIGLACPIIIHFLLIWLDSPTSSTVYPYSLALSLFILQILATVLYNKQFELAQRTGYRLRTGISMVLFRKYFVLSNDSRQVYSVGKIVNISSTDTLKIDLACQYFHMMWCSVALLIGAFGIIYSFLGPATLVGAGIIVIYLPIQYYLSQLTSHYRRATNIWTDQRMKLIHESLKGIRVIKSYGWENSFLDSIKRLRAKESSLLRRFLAVRATTSSVTQAVPTLAMIGTFVAYYLLGNPLTISLVVPALALFYALRVPMLFIPIAISYTIDAWISAGRIGTFLNAAELDEKPNLMPSDDSKPAMVIENANFQWNSMSDEPSKRGSLLDINLTITRGSLVAVVGTVGSGKSSLLQAIIGEMKKISGSVDIYGSISYAQQQAWITNSSLKDNILFGLPMEESKFSKVVQACSLERDISILQGGSSAEIGENGINLSGGQKARVSLARCVYSDSEILLLDDPLSAVDAHVGKDLFDNCINGMLKNKTRILVTHQLHFIDKADLIVLMNEGRIVARGTYVELMKNSREFSEMMTGFQGDSQLEPKETNSSNFSVVDPSPPKSEFLTQKSFNPPKALIVSEERALGAVSAKVLFDYNLYFGGTFVILFLLFHAGISNAARIFTDQWIVYWASNKYSLTPSSYIWLYAILAICQMIFTIFYGLVTATYGSKASKEIHNNALTKVYHSPVAFFDSTPIGRITSRFSRDTDTLDSLLPEAIRAFSWTLIFVFVNLILISVFLPTFLVAVAVALCFYYLLQKNYRNTARELRRIDSVSRSPVISLVTETLTGLTTIRAFEAADRFLKKNYEFSDKNNQAQYLVFLTQRWVQIRLDCINSVLVFLATIFAVAFNLNSGFAGILIAYALQITQTFSWTIKTGVDFETFLNSAERMIFYINDIKSERPAIIPENKPVSSWPQKGCLVWKDVSMRYRTELPLVLHNVSFEFFPGQKIGICGRTGAGKSSILNALLRLTEYEQGTITLDGIDISKIGLHDLRNAISIIPQEPMLFSGSLRLNLDPFSKHADEELWDAVKRSGLVQSCNFPLGLDTLISDGGENFSVGQRQLICLARALLRRSKLVLLDEATASVDFETDDAIQKAIRSDFNESTVVTIAHRLLTIADYDRIMVMSFGKVVEFDTPKNLLKDPNSQFSLMVMETGDMNASVIKQLADEHDVKDEFKNKSS